LSQHITEKAEVMLNPKELILSVFIFAFGLATATHAQEVNTLFTTPQKFVVFLSQMKERRFWRHI
jgi:hypothetical protein